MAAMQLFDTLQYANRLQAAGVERAQAEAHAEALAGALESCAGELATKADLRELESRLLGTLQQGQARAEGAMRELEERMGGAMRELELRLTVKLGLMLAVAIGVLATLSRLGI